MRDFCSNRLPVREVLSRKYIVRERGVFFDTNLRKRVFSMFVRVETSQMENHDMSEDRAKMSDI